MLFSTHILRNCTEDRHCHCSSWGLLRIVRRLPGLGLLMRHRHQLRHIFIPLNSVVEAYRCMLLDVMNMIRFWPLLVSRGLRGIRLLLNTLWWWLNRNLVDN